MKIRFLQATASAVPGFPFQVGQVIDVPSLTPELRDALNTDRAEVVREEPHMQTAQIDPQTQKRTTKTRAVRV